MRSYFARLGLYTKVFLAGAAGMIAVLLVIHLVQLYLSLLSIINFVNTYGPKIQQLK